MMTVENPPKHGLKRLDDRSYLATIPAGDLHLRMTREDIPLADALDFAARNNTKRHFLFVSKLLGRHLPTPPQHLRSAAAALAEKLRASRLPEPCLFVGMAETATTLGQAVFREWTRAGGRGLYLDTTRRRTSGKVAFTFTEAHSHAPGHAVHLPSPEDDPNDIFGNAATLVIIDDEMTTGRTAANLLAAYEDRCGRPIPAHLAVLVRWSAPHDAETKFQTHALLEGAFEFLPSPQFTPQPVASANGGVANIAPRGTRHGLTTPQTSPWSDLLCGRVLVLGIGEFGFIPLLLAEQIEANGGEAFLQCTTRSPVALGGAIGHVRSFPAISGEGYAEFLYNVPDDHRYDRVILCCEDRLPAPGHPILALPRLECRLMP